MAEITPKSIRIRKMILDEQKRRRANAEKLGKKSARKRKDRLVKHNRDKF